ncbi:DUF4189 domain-containing protein [Stenotrophomonas sp. S41]|nr:DUF4189 domain-containing protein [Stenotrophomonas sp. S41]
MSVLTKIVIVSTLFLSAAAFAQQPGSVQYNTVYLPGHGVGDTKAPPAKWGAWARGDDRTLGITFDGRTEDEAKALAVADCQAKGSKNCLPMETFFNTCALVAAGPSNRIIQTSNRGLPWGRRQALKACGDDCKIVVEGCALP